MHSKTRIKQCKCYFKFNNLKCIIAAKMKIKTPLTCVFSMYFIRIKNWIWIKQNVLPVAVFDDWNQWNLSLIISVNHRKRKTRLFQVLSSRSKDQDQSLYVNLCQNCQKQTKSEKQDFFRMSSTVTVLQLQK